MSVYQPQAGDIGLTIIRGQVGLFVRLGELLLDGNARFQHAFIMIDDYRCVEAKPGGARVGNIDQFRDKDTRYSGEYGYELTPEQRKVAVEKAISLIGTPYSFLDYLALFLKKIRLPSKWAQRRVESSGHMICSQLVNECWVAAGVDVIDQGRSSQEVTPGQIWAVWNDHKGSL